MESAAVPSHQRLGLDDDGGIGDGRTKFSAARRPRDFRADAKIESSMWKY